MKFLYPLALLLLLFLPWIIYLWKREKIYTIFRRNLSSIGIFYELFRWVANQKEWRWIDISRFISSCLLFVLAVFLIAYPVSVQEKENPMANGVDIVLVLDLSKSMLAEDIQPNRIESAKQAMIQFVQSSWYNRIGIVWFAGKPFIFSPLTFDTNGLTTVIQKITVDSIRQEIPGFSGTAIGDWLLLATSTLEINPERKKIILLLTDGEANVGTDPRSTLPFIKQLGTTIYSIGIGNPEWTELYTTNAFGEKEYFTDASGVPIRATLDEDLMKLLSEETGWKYVNIQSRQALIDALENISKLYAKPLETPKILEYKSQISWLLWSIFFTLLFLLIIEQFDARSRFRYIHYLSRLPLSFLQKYHVQILEKSQNYEVITWKYRVKSWLLITALILGILAKGWWISDMPPEKIVLLIDISKSMSVLDISDNKGMLSRIDATKKLAINIIQNSPETPTAIMIFGNGTRLNTPFTIDKRELIRNIEAITLGDLPGKTNISWWIQEAKLLFERNSPGHIVLFTDGEETYEWSKNKELYLWENKTIEIFAVGTKNGGEIPVWKDAFGNEYVKSVDGKAIISRMNTNLLREILPSASIISIGSSADISLGILSVLKSVSRWVSWNTFILGAITSILCWLALLLFVSLPYRRVKNPSYSKTT